MSSSDDFFLTWSDLDLDELLGDYTDDDFQSLDSSVSDAGTADWFLRYRIGLYVTSALLRGILRPKNPTYTYNWRRRR